MKDLAAGASIHDLAQAGVASLKIEGRKKSPLYVAAAVNYHRKLLDRAFKAGEQEQCAHDLRTIFSRPWTGLYLKSKANRDVIDPDATGHRGTPVGRVENSGRDFLQFRPSLPLEVHDRSPGRAARRKRGLRVRRREILYPTAAASSRRPRRRFCRCRCRRGSAHSQGHGAVSPPRRPSSGATVRPCPIRRTCAALPARRRTRLSADRVEARAAARADGHGLAASATLAGPFAAAKNPDAAAAALQAAFSRLGDTSFELRKLAQDGPAVFIPVSQLNALRRDLTAALEQQRRDARSGTSNRPSPPLPLEPFYPVPRPLPQERPAFCRRPTSPPSFSAAFPDGEIPRVTEQIVELGRVSAEQIEADWQNEPSGSRALRAARLSRARDRERWGPVTGISTPGPPPWEPRTFA
jgi:putative protease